MLGSLALTRSGMVALGLFYTATIQMQMVDYILFKNPVCNARNTVATRAGILINHLEPLVFYAALLGSGVSLPPIVHMVVATYTVMAGIYVLKALKSVTCTTVSSTSAPYLHWKWNNMDGNMVVYGLFLLVLVLLSVYGMAGDVGTFHAVLVILSFGLSFHKYRGKRATGALWCWFAAFIPYMMVFAATS